MDENLNTQNEAKIAEITKRKECLEKDLQAKNQEIEDCIAMKKASSDQRMQDYREKEKSLLKNLSASTKDSLKERFKFEKRIKVWKTIGVLLTILYFVAVCYAVFVLKVDLYVRKLIAYPLLASFSISCLLKLRVLIPITKLQKSMRFLPFKTMMTQGEITWSDMITLVRTRKYSSVA